MWQKLYVRIWLAVVLAVAVLTLLVGWAWRAASEPPLREVVVRNAQGQVIGSGRLRPPPDSPEAQEWRRQHRAARAGAEPPGPRPEIAATSPASATDVSQEVDDDALPDARPGDGAARSRYGAGPEFSVRMADGQTMHLHMPRPGPSAWRAPFGFFWTLGLVAVAVALALFPIVRRLTRRLEALQQGVQQWGQGQLNVRVDTRGNDEVADLARRFNDAAEQVENLVNTRDALLASQRSLLANASHELRSPLTRIRMGIELLGDSASPAARQEIARNIGELDLLIEEILLASRLDAQQADIGTVEPVELVGLCAEECARTGAELDTQASEVLVPGVSKLLRRAVRNLLENARRHGAGAVSLGLSQANGEVSLRVCDRGPGVPLELTERIFEPFYRLPGASERDGGVGLGLALVKSITERHHGTVRCTPREGGGACFEVRLPLAPTTQAR